MNPDVAVAQHRLLGHALWTIHRDLYGEEGPHAAAQAEHDEELLAFAARDLVCAVDAAPADEQPVGWRPASDCCKGTGMADFAAVPCPDPGCPVLVAARAGEATAAADSSSLANLTARLRAIIDGARCQGCNATQEECRRLFAATTDPIGCCHPHDHRIYQSDLRSLLRESEAGEVAAPTVKEEPPRPSWYILLDQGEVWYPRPPADAVRIADMDSEWRRNCARMLLRGAAGYALEYGFGEIATLSGPLGPHGDEPMFAAESAIHHLDEVRTRDPQSWMRTTVLYRALTADLPTDAEDAGQRAERTVS